jgi:hypothetical protein
MKRRWLVVILIGLATVALVAVPASRAALLRGVGRGLVARDALQRADAIVIANDAEAAGALEAADLVHERIAPRVVVFRRAVSPAARAFAQRGLPYEDSAALITRELRELGITAVEEIPQPVTGTEAEGRILPAWCRAQRYRVIVFVSTPDHSRRTRRVLHRAARDQSVRIIVWYSHYSSFDPNTWWRTRGGVRTAIEEYEKLLLDILRHPLS